MRQCDFTVQLLQQKHTKHLHTRYKALEPVIGIPKHPPQRPGLGLLSHRRRQRVVVIVVIRPLLEIGRTVEPTLHIT